MKNLCNRHLLYRISLMSKFCILLLMSSMLTVIAKESYAQKVKISLEMNNMNNTPLSAVINEIKRQTEFEFAYDSELESITFKKVSIKISDENIDNVLVSVLEGTGISYKIIDRIILLSKNKVITTEVTKQVITIKGTVTEENGAPLPGVNVTVKGKPIGVITDIDGKYSINVPEATDILTFSFVGFVTGEFSVGSQKTIDVVMEEDTRQIDEVVVVGYGSVRKKDLTGSVGSVKSGEISSGKVTNISASLQGRIAGVDIVETSQRPGSVGTIRIRGNRSIGATNEPLYIVDGIPFNGALSTIPPQDIESIDVLKDASATAIYGSRAANGVIIITTCSMALVLSTISVMHTLPKAITATSIVRQTTSNRFSTRMIWLQSLSGWDGKVEPMILPR